MKSLYALALGAALLASAANAEPYELDKSHATVSFTADHLGFSMTHGFFTKMDADIDYDEENPENSTVVFTIDAASVNTLWKARDEHVRNSDFLDVKNHPELVFKSTKVEMTGEKTAKLTGDLTIRGITHEEVFDVTLRRADPSPFGQPKYIIGFSAETVIDRSKYGIKYAIPAIPAEIPVKVDLEIFKRTDS